MILQKPWSSFSTNLAQIVLNFQKNCHKKMQINVWFHQLLACEHGLYWDKQLVELILQLDTIKTVQNRAPVRPQMNQSMQKKWCFCLFVISVLWNISFLNAPHTSLLSCMLRLHHGSFTKSVSIAFLVFLCLNWKHMEMHFNGGGQHGQNDHVDNYP